MNTRSKVVELQGKKYSLRKLPPAVGSFIFMRLMSASMRMAASVEEKPVKKARKAQEPTPEAAKLSGEAQVRVLSFSVFSGGMNFDDYKFIQDACMKATAVVVERAGQDFPMPIMEEDGSWLPDGEPIADDVGLVMQLTTEVLILCFADFFERGGMSL